VVRPGTGPHPLERHGLERTGLFGDVRIRPGEIEVARSLDALASQPPDYVLVCCKTTASAEVAEGLGRFASLHGLRAPVVVCQNGWGNAEVFAAQLPAEQIYNARIITGYVRTAEHVVDITVHANAMHVGSLFGGALEPMEPLCRAISAGGMPCLTAPDIERDLWAKVLYNCLLNPLGALVRVPYGALGEGPHTRALMRAVAEEIFEVLAASRHRTHWASADEYLEQFYAQLLPITAEHESSMLHDLLNGRATEIDAMSGAVVALAESLGMDAPINRALTCLVHAAEARALSGLSLSGPLLSDPSLSGP